MRNVVVRKRKSTPFGPFRIDVVDLQVRRRDGISQKIKRVSFERGDSVAVLVHRLDTHSILLARQFRYPAFANSGERGNGMILELPAGVREKGETPRRTAAREVAEELGYKLLTLQHIATFFVSPGGTSERILLYYATARGRPNSDGGGVAAEGEDIEVMSVPVRKFIEMIKGNSIRDGKTLLAGYWFILQRKWMARPSGGRVSRR
jgi:nudix-type nucleoside diphosphatase (YffH/AdpP family)